MLTCNCRRNCTLAAVVASLIVGIIAAFLQITAVITVAPVFLWVAFGVAVSFLGILVLTAGSSCGIRQCGCHCVTLRTLLAGILGTILLAAVLLAVGIVATGVINAILVGILVFFLALTLTAAACYVRCLSACEG